MSVVLVVTAGDQPRRSDHQLVDACRTVPGVIVLNAMVTDEPGRTREVDGILFTRTRVYAVETKGTRLQGAVVAHANRPWTVGGAPADFYGGPNPLRQARVAAQSLAALLEDAGLDLGFITPVVAVSGHKVTVAPERVGDTLVSVLADLPAQVEQDGNRLLPVELVQDACRRLGIEVTAADLEREGFPRRGARAHRDHRNARLRNAARDQLLDAFSALPGFLVDAPRTGAPTGPDHHAVAVTPAGVFAVKSKSTTLRGHVDIAGHPWVIGGRQAHLGRDEPGRQARSMATWLHKSLERDHELRVPVTPVLALAGDRLDLAVTQRDGVWLTRCRDLAGVLLRHQVRNRLYAEDAQAVLAALGHPVRLADLLEEGFLPQPPAPRESHSESRRRQHRADRLAMFAEQAETQWRAQHRHHLMASLLTVGLLVAATVWLPVQSTAGACAAMLVAGGWQLHRRRRSAGAVLSGAAHAAGWLVSLMPYGALGALAVGAAWYPSWHDGAGLLLALLHLTSALLCGLCLLVGRSAFVYPPAAVYERLSADGRPTGSFRISRRTPRDENSQWVPVQR